MSNRTEVEKAQPPSDVTDPLSDNKHSAPSEDPSPAGAGIERYEAPRLRTIGALPSLEIHLRASRLRPGQLSMGLYADSDTWTGVLEALTAAGFKVGDVCRLTVVRR